MKSNGLFVLEWKANNEKPYYYPAPDYCCHPVGAWCLPRSCLLASKLCPFSPVLCLPGTAPLAPPPAPFSPASKAVVAFSSLLSCLPSSQFYFFVLSLFSQAATLHSKSQENHLLTEFFLGSMGSKSLHNDSANL